MIDYEEELTPIGELFTDGAYKEALDELEKKWGDLPTPKEDNKNTHLFVLYGVKISQINGDFDLAWEWAQRGLLYNANQGLKMS